MEAIPDDSYEKLEGVFEATITDPERGTKWAAFNFIGCKIFPVCIPIGRLYEAGVTALDKLDEGKTRISAFVRRDVNEEGRLDPTNIEPI